jgi:hypothetical protein
MMWYAKVKDVPPAETRRQIEAALIEQGMTLDDLLRKLAFPNFQQGRERFDRIFAGEEDTQLLRRVSSRLGLDHESLSGERVFEDREDFLRFTFVPTLERVPEDLDPTKHPGGMQLMLLPRIFVAKRLPGIAELPCQEQHREIAKVIRADMEKTKGGVPGFGDIIGYAF